MLKSLSSAVSGLQNHQTMMDVIGNNIANVNTAGFKSSRVVFSDVYYQTITPASEATPNIGGTNAMQTGYGSKVAAIDVSDTSSGKTETGRTLDQYIDGEGYFILKDSAGNTCYSRLGNFYFDSSGNLVDSKGSFVCDDTGGEINVSDLSDYSSVSISSTGAITGVNASTNTTESLGQIGLAYFANPDGLSQNGNGYYAETANSGSATLATPEESGTGSLVSGALEASNVDLTEEFTNMIVAQRGFQANARVITTSDSMLEELVNLKRQ